MERLYRFEHVLSSINFFGAYLGIAAISLSLISNSVSGNEIKKKKKRKKKREKRKRLKWDAKGALVKFVNDFFEPGHWQTWAWCRQRVSTRKKKSRRSTSVDESVFLFFFLDDLRFFFLFLFKIFFFFCLNWSLDLCIRLFWYITPVVNIRRRRTLALEARWQHHTRHHQNL